MEIIEDGTRRYLCLEGGCSDEMTPLWATDG